MGWSIGYDEQWKRDIGYGVPAYCDHPGCNEEIDRGLGYKCESPRCGCEKFYCEKHRYGKHSHKAPPSREHPLWMKHVLTDKSWKTWRDSHPTEVAAFRAALDAAMAAERGEG